MPPRSSRVVPSPSPPSVPGGGPPPPAVGGSGGGRRRRRTPPPSSSSSSAAGVVDPGVVGGGAARASSTPPGIGRFHGRSRRSGGGGMPVRRGMRSIARPIFSSSRGGGGEGGKPATTTTTRHPPPPPTPTLLPPAATPPPRRAKSMPARLRHNISSFWRRSDPAGAAAHRKGGREEGGLPSNEEEKRGRSSNDGAGGGGRRRSQSNEEWRGRSSNDRPCGGERSRSQNNLAGSRRRSQSNEEGRGRSSNDRPCGGERSRSQNNLAGSRRRSQSNEEGRGRSSNDRACSGERSRSQNNLAGSRRRSQNNEEGRGRSSRDHHAGRGRRTGPGNLAGSRMRRSSSNEEGRERSSRDHAGRGRSTSTARRGGGGGGGGGGGTTRRHRCDPIGRSSRLVSLSDGEKEKTTLPWRRSEVPSTDKVDDAWKSKVDDLRRHRQQQRQIRREQRPESGGGKMGSDQFGNEYYGNHESDDRYAPRERGRNAFVDKSTRNTRGRSARNDPVQSSSNVVKERSSDVERRSKSMPPPLSAWLTGPVITCDLVRSAESFASPIASYDSSWIHQLKKIHRLRRETEERRYCQEEWMENSSLITTEEEEKLRSKSCGPKLLSSLKLLTSGQHDADERAIIPYAKSKKYNHHILDILGVEEGEGPERRGRRLRIRPCTEVSQRKRAPDPVTSLPGTFDGETLPSTGEMTTLTSMPGGSVDGESSPSTGEISTSATLEEYRTHPSNPPTDGFKRPFDPMDPAAFADDRDGTASTPGNAIVGRSADKASRPDPSPENESNRSDVDDDGSVGSLFGDAPSTLGTNEVKTDPECAAPPLHSEVRSKKPKQLPHHSVPRKVVPSKVDFNESQVSGITIPVALRRAPRQLPARIWEEKPKNRSHVRPSVHKESKGERSKKGDVTVTFSDSTAASTGVSGSKVGVELEINSTFSPNQISELTMAAPKNEQMLVLAFKRYQQLTQKMAHPPRLVEQHQKAAAPVPSPPFPRGNISRTVTQHQQSAVPMPPPSHPPEHGSRGVEEQQEESPCVLASQKALVPRPPPPRPLVARPPPGDNHWHTIQQLATINQINVGVASMLDNTNDHHPQRRHQSQPHQSMNVQRRQRDEANEFTLPLKPPRGTPQSPQATHRSMEEMMKQSGQAMHRSMEEITKLPRGERLPFAGGRGNTRSNGSQRKGRVENMFITDQCGDTGMYTGETNEHGNAHGKGRMKYDNGVTFEGKWINGVRDGGFALRERVMTGFTSWNGPKKKHTHGMVWVDQLGTTGRYTGNLNQEGVPHGNGMMIYSTGLIAEGMWVNGRIIEDNLQGNPPSLPILGTVVGGQGGIPIPRDIRRIS